MATTGRRERTGSMLQQSLREPSLWFCKSQCSRSCLFYFGFSRDYAVSSQSDLVHSDYIIQHMGRSCVSLTRSEWETSKKLDREPHQAPAKTDSPGKWPPRMVKPLVLVILGRKHCMGDSFQYVRFVSFKLCSPLCLWEWQWWYRQRDGRQSIQNHTPGMLIVLYQF